MFGECEKKRKEIEKGMMVSLLFMVPIVVFPRRRELATVVFLHGNPFMSAGLPSSNESIALTSKDIRGTKCKKVRERKGAGKMQETKEIKKARRERGRGK